VRRRSEPLERWLRWEEQANLVGFRVTTAPVRVPVASVAAASVSTVVAPGAPVEVVRRFLRGERVCYPRHPLNSDPTVAFHDAPAAEHWEARFTSSRTLAVVPSRGPVFSIKLPTDHPHPDFVQPEKTRIREEAENALAQAARIDGADAALGADPWLRLVREVITVLVPGTASGFIVRDLRPLQDGRLYLPALSIPWVGRAIATIHGEPFDVFWGRHYAEAAGRAKASLLARYALQYDTPNPQNLLVQLDRGLRPTGAMVLRDLGDTESVSAPAGTEDEANPWGRLAREVRPETRNSFWAFDGAGEHRVSAETLERWYALHDAAYLGELRSALDLPSQVSDERDAPFAALDAWLRSPVGIAAARAAWDKRRRRQPGRTRVR
jgi:hypothetical protein